MADKGGAVVIMNTKHYLKMITDHLKDETTYKMVEGNCDAKLMKGIAKIIEKYKYNLTKRKRISYDIHKDIFACLFSIHNTISLSCHEQVCLSGLRFKRYFSHHRAT